MATNPNVLIDREKYIGGSEISTILGINKFMTRWELLQLKAGYKENDFQGNVYTQYGDTMEAKIRDYINTLGISKTPFIEDTIALEEPVIGRRCNYDGKSKTHGLEIKTTSQIHENVRDYKYYVVQLLYGMILGKLKKGILAVYHRPENFDTEFNSSRLQVFEINISDFKDWCEEIEDAIAQFKIDLAKLKENPFLSEQDLLPIEIVNLAIKIDEIEEELSKFKLLEQKQESIKASLLSAMKEYNIKKWTTPGNTKITLVEEKEDEEFEYEEYDEEKFKKENPELYEKYMATLSGYKEIKRGIKKGRAAYLKITLPK